MERRLTDSDWSESTSATAANSLITRSLPTATAATASTAAEAETEVHQRAGSSEKLIRHLESEVEQQRQLRLADAKQVEAKAARIKDWVTNKLRELEEQNQHLKQQNQHCNRQMEMLRSRLEQLQTTGGVDRSSSAAGGAAAAGAAAGSRSRKSAAEVSLPTSAYWDVIAAEIVLKS